jgi:uncharacterized membrane protein HdeD (DUF308 family)
MIKEQMYAVMFFVLALFLIACGIGLYTIREKVPFTVNFYVHPYALGSGIMIIIGVLLLVAAFCIFFLSKKAL